jgi:hypothetical protein
LGKAAAAKLEAARVPDTRPSVGLEKYAGTYSDSMYGDVTVRAQNGKLRLNYGGMSDGALEHWHYDTFRAVWANRLLGKSMVTFVIDGAAKVAEMRIENLADFKRAAVKADTTTREGQGGGSTGAGFASGAHSHAVTPFLERSPAVARGISRSPHPAEVHP